MDAVERPQFRVVGGTRAPSLRWPGGWGGHGLPVPVRRGASRGGVPWGGARVSPRNGPRGRFPLPGHRAGSVGGQRVIGLLRVGGLCHFCVRPCAARVVFPLLRRALCALAVWLCCYWGGERRGARALLVGWSVPVSLTSVIAPLSRGRAVGGAVCPPLAQAFGRPRAPVAACPWRAVPLAARRSPTLGGRWRMSWTLRMLPSGGPSEVRPVARARLA